MTTSANIPGIRDLLSPIGTKSHSPEQRIKAADNAMLPLMEGIGAIGALLSSQDHGKGLSEESLADAGYLLSFLSELGGSLQQIKDDAVYEQMHGRAPEYVS